MLTVIIITKNEEARIRRCLQSVQFADEIIVLDSGSTDNTLSIVKEYTNLVFSTDWLGYGIQKQRALEKAHGDWVLNLDADEVLSEGLQAEIRHVMSLNVADAYRIPIRMHFNNQSLKYSWSPKRHIRLFKRVLGHYEKDIIHEKITLDAGARVGKLSNFIMHYSFKDIKHAQDKINQYSSYTAKTRLQSSRKHSILMILLNTAWMFFRSFILQRGFLDGRLGFLFAIFNAQGTFYRGIKQIYPDEQHVSSS